MVAFPSEEMAHIDTETIDGALSTNPLPETKRDMN